MIQWLARMGIPLIALSVAFGIFGGDADGTSGSPGASLALLAGDMRGAGSVDGAGSAASFNFPRGIATDDAGNIYVADTGNRTIRKITPSGVVTTLAGSTGVKGSTDTAEAAASFNALYGVVADGAGNVYVADHAIRKVTPSGAVTTLAGSAGATGHADGAGAAASFNLPHGVARDAVGNIYVADTLNNAIRKVSPAGIVTTLAGAAGGAGHADGAGAEARFNFPQGLATDRGGNVYVADSLNNTIRKMTPGGVVTTLAGTPGVSGGSDGAGAAATFNFPKGIATDGAGNVYVADTGNHTIRKITPKGVATTLAGAAGVTGSTDGAAAKFNFPQDVATDAEGNVYVADTLNSTIRKITPAGVVTTLAGSASVRGSIDAIGSAARFGAPRGVAADSAGNVYVTDNSNNTIRKITPAGIVTAFAGTAGVKGSADAAGMAASFNFPQGVATDGAGNVYLADTGNHTIRKITPGRVVSTLAGSAGNFGHADGRGAAASFVFPFGVATDGAGNVYVADTFNDTVRKISSDGAVTTLAGLAGAPGSVDGSGPAARFNAPRGIATDIAGNVYVAETGNRAIRKITPDGIVTTLAGSPRASGSVDGTGAAASFDAPFGIAADSAGNLYVADGDSYTIRKVTPRGVVTTVVGVAGQPGFVPGALPGRLGSPQGVAVNGSSLYITLYNGVATVRNRP